MEAQIDGKHSLLPVGTLLFHGTYRVVRHLASGGFGNTYEAVDTQLGDSVAIKEFFPKQLCGRSSEGGTVTLEVSDGSRRPPPPRTTQAPPRPAPGGGAPSLPDSINIPGFGRIPLPR